MIDGNYNLKLIDFGDSKRKNISNNNVDLLTSSIIKHNE
jgi:hypothetical protein